MSSNGPLMDAEALRKKVSGMVFGSIPASVTCETKFVIWAATRHGAVTGETSARLSTGTVVPLWAAASMAARSASSSPVVAADVSILAVPVGVWTHQASAVRRTDVVMSWLLSGGRSGG